MIISRTPFRVSFFGGGTDYPIWYKENGGAVLSTTIDKYCFITCRYLPPFFEHKTRVVWSKIESVKSADELEHPSARAVINFLNIDKGLEIHHDADLPARSGLGASSSFTVGLLNALNALQGKLLSKKQLALDAIHVEQDIMRENVGSQDQTAAAFGGLNKIEFGTPDHLGVTPVTVGNRKIELLERHLMLIFTGMARSASEIAGEQINNAHNKMEELKMMHKMVGKAVDILSRPSDDIDDFGGLLHESWSIKRELAPRITNSFIDDIYNDARSAGALGGKLLGAGAGGFMLFFAHPDAQPRISEKLGKFLRVPFKFENSGSQIVYYAPAENHYES